VIEDRLATVRDALRLDGYDLHVVDAAETLSVRIVALDGACEDCLVPQSVMAATLSAALGGGYPPERIAIEYP
jgi:Fe-S cluster biogenesis protein NfuA